jgi:hypothetical protein
MKRGILTMVLAGAGTLAGSTMVGCLGSSASQVETQLDYNFTVDADRAKWKFEGLKYQGSVGPYAVFQVTDPQQRITGPRVAIPGSDGVSVIASAKNYFINGTATEAAFGLTANGNMVVQCKQQPTNQGSCTMPSSNTGTTPTNPTPPPNEAGDLGGSWGTGCNKAHDGGSASGGWGSSSGGSSGGWGGGGGSGYGGSGGSGGGGGYGGGSSGGGSYSNPGGYGGGGWSNNGCSDMGASSSSGSNSSPDGGASFPTGGSNTGGSNTGGSNTGGSNTGGSNTGGSNTGGSNTSSGGSNTTGGNGQGGPGGPGSGTGGGNGGGPGSAGSPGSASDSNGGADVAVVFENPAPVGSTVLLRKVTIHTSNSTRSADTDPGICCTSGSCSLATSGGSVK